MLNRYRSTQRLIAASVLAISLSLGPLTADATATVGPFFQPTDALDESTSSHSATEFMRGDCNASTTFDIADPIAVLDFAFGGLTTRACQDACDTNDDGSIDIAEQALLGNVVGNVGVSDQASGERVSKVGVIDELIRQSLRTRVIRWRHRASYV